MCSSFQLQVEREDGGFCQLSSRAWASYSWEPHLPKWVKLWDTEMELQNISKSNAHSKPSEAILLWYSDFVSLHIYFICLH